MFLVLSAKYLKVQQISKKRTFFHANHVVDKLELSKVDYFYSNKNTKKSETLFQHTDSKLSRKEI
jgi:hypothetical protein